MDQRQKRLKPWLLWKLATNLDRSGRKIEHFGTRGFLYDAQQFLRAVLVELQCRGQVRVYPNELVTLHTDCVWVQISPEDFWGTDPFLDLKCLSFWEDAHGRSYFSHYGDFNNNPYRFVEELLRLSERYYVYRRKKRKRFFVECYRRDQIKPAFHDMDVDDVRPLINDLRVRRLS